MFLKSNINEIIVIYLKPGLNKLDSVLKAFSIFSAKDLEMSLIDLHNAKIINFNIDNGTIYIEPKLKTLINFIREYELDKFYHNNSINDKMKSMLELLSKENFIINKSSPYYQFLNNLARHVFKCDFSYEISLLSVK